MKKILVGLSLGALLVGGFAFAQETNPTDFSMDREPTIYRVVGSPVHF